MSTTLKDRLGIEADAEAGVDRVRTLSPLEQEWKKKTYDKLLEIADLTMLAALDKNKGRAQIREITQRLFTEMGHRWRSRSVSCWRGASRTRCWALGLSSPC